jgi:hypothetical protein
MNALITPHAVVDTQNENSLIVLEKFKYKQILIVMGIRMLHQRAVGQVTQIIEGCRNTR